MGEEERDRAILLTGLMAIGFLAFSGIQL